MQISSKLFGAICTELALIAKERKETLDKMPTIRHAVDNYMQAYLAGFARAVSSINNLPLNDVQGMIGSVCQEFGMGQEAHGFVWDRLNFTVVNRE